MGIGALARSNILWILPIVVYCLPLTVQLTMKIFEYLMKELELVVCM
jgi:hypothetical protein